MAASGDEISMSEKLQEWWKFADFAAFREEIKKCFKSTIPLAERKAWEDRLKTDKSEVAKLTLEIQLSEARINAIFFEVFELTTEQVSLLRD